MAEKGPYRTAALVPLLAERGVSLSRVRIHRLVTRQPQRLCMATLAALCDVLDCCTLNDLTEAKGGTGVQAAGPASRPLR
ncbi:helix-turn-helix transcriptional regulator [Streptomyces sp. NPDC097610]|uniref:helix-turn-helix domain-containing protein n=1 Tax=Streptomyces sp. NPDC097610 TaxID=3157227 RepID=UPI00331B5163